MEYSKTSVFQPIKTKSAQPIKPKTETSNEPRYMESATGRHLTHPEITSNEQKKAQVDEPRFYSNHRMIPQPRGQERKVGWLNGGASFEFDNAEHQPHGQERPPAKAQPALTPKPIFDGVKGRHPNDNEFHPPKAEPPLPPQPKFDRAKGRHPNDNELRPPKTKPPLPPKPKFDRAKGRHPNDNELRPPKTKPPLPPKPKFDRAKGRHPNDNELRPPKTKPPLPPKPKFDRAKGRYPNDNELRPPKTKPPLPPKPKFDRAKERHPNDNELHLSKTKPPLPSKPKLTTEEKRRYMEPARPEAEDISEEQGSGFRAAFSSVIKVSPKLIAMKNEERVPRRNFTAPICQGMVVADGVSERGNGEVLKKVKEGKKRLDNSDSRERHERQFGKSKTDRNRDQADDDDIMIVDEHFKNSEGNKKSLSPKNKLGGLSKEEKEKNELKQKYLAREFQQQQNSTGAKRKHPSPQNVSTSGTKRKSDPDSDQEQTCVMTVWEPALSVSDRIPHIPPRQQRLVGAVHPAVSEASSAPPLALWQRIPQTYPTYPAPQHPVVSSSSDHSVPVPQNTYLRYVIIDGSNVAMAHGNSKLFSCKGIQITVDYFLDRGHKVTVFVPEWRKYRNYCENKIRDQEILQKLEESGHLVFTPSRRIQGKLVASYDDRFILTLAEKEDSVILSNDQYRDLMREKAAWKKIVEERLLMYRFVVDHFMPAEDPLGRNGPMLDDFLKKHHKPDTTSSPRSPYNYNRNFLLNFVDHL